MSTVLTKTNIVIHVNIFFSIKKKFLTCHLFVLFIRYLDKGGWDTINTWLQYAKSSPSHCVLLDMLKLCKYLPMTLNRLKENNTAKVIKSLTKHENSGKFVNLLL